MGYITINYDGKTYKVKKGLPLCAVDGLSYMEKCLNYIKVYGIAPEPVPDFYIGKTPEDILKEHPELSGECKDCEVKR